MGIWVPDRIGLGLGQLNVALKSFFLRLLTDGFLHTH